MFNTRICKIASLLIVIFVAGIVVGVVMAPRLNMQVRAAATRQTPLTTEQRIDQRMVEFTQRLKLTPKQEDALRELWRAHASEMQRLNGIRRRHAHDVFENTGAKVRDQLTSEQQPEYDRMIKAMGRPRANAGQ